MATRPPRTFTATSTRSDVWRASASASRGGSAKAAVPSTTRACSSPQAPRHRRGAAQPAAVLDGDAGVGGDPSELLQVHGLPRPRAVEVDHVQEASSGRNPPPRRRERVGIVHGAGREVTLAQAHGGPGEDVDRRIEVHEPTGTALQMLQEVRQQAQPCAGGLLGVELHAEEEPRSTAVTNVVPYEAVPRMSSSRAGTGARECTW